MGCVNLNHLLLSLLLRHRDYSPPHRVYSSRLPNNMLNSKQWWGVLMQGKELILIKISTEKKYFKVFRLKGLWPTSQPNDRRKIILIHFWYTVPVTCCLSFLHTSSAVIFLLLILHKCGISCCINGQAFSLKWSTH